MRRMLENINIPNEMTKKDIIETILFILNKILDYTSKLDEEIPSIFDRKEKEEKNKEADLSTDETSDKENENNDISTTDEKEKIPLAEYVYYWTEKLNFNENMLFLMMMNLDKILNSKKIILNQKNIENVLFTCMIITQKYHEDIIFSDKDYSKLLNIDCDEIIEMQMKYLESIDYSLLIDKEDLDQYKIKMKRIWRSNMLFLMNS